MHKNENKNNDEKKIEISANKIAPSATKGY
jgi:hypothetical protein